MTVETIMSLKIVTVEMDEALERVREIFGLFVPGSFYASRVPQQKWSPWAQEKIFTNERPQN